MASLKNIAASLKGRVLGDVLVRRNPLYYKRAITTIESLESAGLDERKEFAAKRMQTVLAYAKRTAYGRASLADAQSIDDCPFLEKEALRDNPADFLATAGWRTSSASTGGTTGVPLKLYRSLQSATFEQAFLDWLALRCAVDLRRAKIAVLRGDNLKDPSDKQPPFWKFTHGDRRMVMSTNHLDQSSAGHYCEALKSFRPDVLQAYPTSLESLCRLIRNANLELRLPFVMTSSELLPTEHRKTAIETLGCKLVDYYGQAERVNFAYSFEPESYLFSPAYAYNELLPIEDSFVFEIVGTAFWNLAMPLVRYRTGDLIRFDVKPTSAELDEVRYGVRPFRGIMGRSGDYLVTPDGGHLMGIDHFPRDVENVARMQVIQEARDFVRVLYLPASGFTNTNLQQIQANVAAKLPASMSVRFEEVTELERTAQQKTPYVIKRPGVE
jgi:phenylacetate-CoA ligase